MKRWPGKELDKRKVPKVYYAGLLAALAMGWSGHKLWEMKNFYTNETLFPKSAIVEGVIDGDNIYLENGQSVRLIGINAPERGKENFEKAKEKLSQITTGRKVFLEYDREDDGQYGRLLAWVWIDCEMTPSFLPYDYMRVGYHRSRSGLTENPEGCQQGKLVNEEMVRAGLANVQTYKDRGELKYEERLMSGN